MHIRESIVAEARTWLGTPYRHQGRRKGLACDCAGLVIGVAHGLGLSEFDFRAYGPLPHSGTLERLLAEHMDRIDVAEASPGDVLVLAWLSEPQHLGIRTNIGILHSYAGARRVVEHRIDEIWQARLRGAYRYRGVG
ncbi:MAG: NlpC/P60 family protein [Gammaproteobacteria bacterium]